MWLQTGSGPGKKASGIVKEDRNLSETPVCSYLRGTKDERWWLAPPDTSGELGKEESFLKGSAGLEQT